MDKSPLVAFLIGCIPPCCFDTHHVMICLKIYETSWNITHDCRKIQKKLHTLWIQTPEKVRKVRKTSLTRNQAPPRRVCRGDKPLHLNVEASRDDLVYRAEARKHITEDRSLSQLKSLDHVFDGFYVFFSEHEMYNLYNSYFHKNWSFNVQDANGF